jgi:hypothetical protein
MRRDCAISVSLANLCLLPTLFVLLDPESYYAAHPLRSEYLGVVLDLLLLALLFLGARLASRRLPDPVRRFGLLAACVVLWMFPLRHAFGVVVTKTAINHYQWSGITMKTVACLLLGYVAVSRWKWVVPGVTAWLIVILLPLAPVTVARSLWSWVNYDFEGSGSRREAAGMLPQVASPRASRVVWMVFDEMGESNVFPSRPATVHLPELDRLRRQSVYARNAFPPAGETLVSMPALINGRLVTAAASTSRYELMLKYQGSARAVPWSKEPNVFSAAREAGFNTALLGCWHPYCKLLGNALSICFEHDWSENSKATGSMGQEIVEALTPKSTILKREHIALYQSVLAEARELVRRPDVDLMLIHWPVPHFPGIYDRQNRQFSQSGSYLDNLELADHALGEVRREMEAAGTWESSNVIVTADHWWRPTLWNQLPAWMGEEGAAYGDGGRRNRRVVFLLKMAGQKEGLTIEESFNTVLLHDLILAMLTRQVTTPEGAAAWIHAHPTAGRGESFIMQ